MSSRSYRVLGTHRSTASERAPNADSLPNDREIHPRVLIHGSICGDLERIIEGDLHYLASVCSEDGVEVEEIA